MVVEGGGLLRRHQRAFRDGGGADAPADRRGDAGIVQIDARGIGIGLGLQIGGAGIVHVLGRDGILGLQPLIALGLDLGGSQGRLGIVQGGAVRRRIDLVKRIALLDGRAFDKQALQDDARHLGPDFGYGKGAGAAGQLGGEGHRRFLDHRHTHHGRGHLRLRGLAAPRQGKAQSQAKCRQSVTQHQNPRMIPCQDDERPGPFQTCLRI